MGASRPPSTSRAGWYDLLLSALEPVPFYAAFIADPRVSGTW